MYYSSFLLIVQINNKVMGVADGSHPSRHVVSCYYIRSAYFTYCQIRNRSRRTVTLFPIFSRPEFKSRSQHHHGERLPAVYRFWKRHSLLIRSVVSHRLTVVHSRTRTRIKENDTCRRTDSDRLHNGGRQRFRDRRHGCTTIYGPRGSLG